MCRFTPLQWLLFCAFCIYWFIIFPLIWFVLSPALFAKDILHALLFAFLLFVVYCVLHLCIICCFERCTERKRRPQHATPSKSTAAAEQPPPLPKSAPPTMEQPVCVHIPDAVLYEKQPRCGNGCGGHCSNCERAQPESLRFISSYELYYDGRRFRNEDAMKNI